MDSKLSEQFKSVKEIMGGGLKVGQLCIFSVKPNLGVPKTSIYHEYLEAHLKNGSKK